jgi:hypothetical protein
MLEVGKTYQRIYPYAFHKDWLKEVTINSHRDGKYFIGSDGNHYDWLGRRGSGGFIDPSDTFCRKYDLLVPSLEEMLKECLD